MLSNFFPLVHSDARFREDLSFADIDSNSLPSLTTLNQFLLRAAQGDSGARIYPSGQTESAGDRLSYREIFDFARRAAKDIRRIPGISTDQVFLLNFDNHTQNILWLWAVIQAGYLPAISPPLSADANSRLQHLHHLKGLLKKPVVLTSGSLVDRFDPILGLSVYAVENFPATSPTVSPIPLKGLPDGDPREPALLSLTQRSCKKVKAVPLTTHQLVASIGGKKDAWRSGDRSVFLNWMGLDSVANLAEVHLHAMFLCAEQVHVHAEDILKDPLLFVKLISKHRVTHTFAPSPFLAILGGRLANASSSEISGIDLSCLQTIATGGGVNSITTVQSLLSRLQGLGANGQVIRMGYGLAETAASLTQDYFDAGYEAKEKHEFVSIGRPVEGALARVTTKVGEDAAPYKVGSLELSGAAVFSGYFNDDAASSKAFTADGWFVTGETAYIDSSGRINLAE